MRPWHQARSRIIDIGFIKEHTSGFDEFAAFCRRQQWTDLQRASGLSREAMIDSARVYMAANAVIANYGMGVTQHKHGVETVKMIVNLLLLRGNIGKPGAGISPIRGHSNVQGQRTVGISEKTKLVPLDRLAELYGFEPPRWDGLTTVDACEKILSGEVRGFISLGGNFCVPPRAIADGAGMVAASPVGADRHQAQQDAPDPGRADLSAALPRANRNRPAGERSAGGRNGGFDRMHPRLSRPAQARCG